MALTGNETFYVLGQDAEGNPAAITQQTTTAAIASLAPTVAHAPVPIGASAAITTANAGGVFLLNTAAGSVATLPAATGSGYRYTFVVTTTTTSGAHKILAASNADFINGLAVGENANTAKVFASAASTSHSIQMPFAGTQPSGGFIGDQYAFIDVGANLWQVNGTYQAGTAPTTPFSAATT